MVLISYSLWAFENRGSGALGVPWTAISVPFTLGLLQYLAAGSTPALRASRRRSSSRTGCSKDLAWCGSPSSPWRSSSREQVGNE